MKERPILFSTPMVQALLNGQKTQTRRTRGLKTINENPNAWYFQSLFLHATGRFTFAPVDKYPVKDEDVVEVKCPYGQPGDLLYVRETFRLSDFPKEEGKYEFKASLESPYASYNEGIWKPSIHMPKAAARIWLQVEEVKVERAQDISDDGIIAEGVRIPVNGIGTNSVVFKLGVENSAFSFLPERKEGEKYNQSQLLHAFWAELWCEVNGRASWNANPWVWVVKFKVLSTAGKPSIPQSFNP